MRRVVAVLVVFTLIVVGYAFATRKQSLPSSCVGPAPSLLVEGSRTTRRLGELVNAGPRSGEQIAADIQRIIWVVRFLFTGFSSGAAGEPVPPEILRRQEADDERRRTSPLCSELAPQADVPLPDCAPDGGGGWDPKTASLQSGFTAETLRIAQVAKRVATEQRIPPRGLLVNFAAGMQESGEGEPQMANLGYGHSSSVGYLQLINSHGTVAQRRDPEFAARWFFTELRKVQDWESMSVTRAAQAVQRSAYPDAYARWEAHAARLMRAIGTAPGECNPSPTTPPPVANLVNRRTPAQAVAYMRTMAATSTPIRPNMCLHYVGVAYGYPTTADNWAIHQWNNAPAKYRHPGDRNPPAGALLFWDVRPGHPGHVAISLGGGIVASTDVPNGRIGIRPLSYFNGYGTYKGWTDPYFRNQTGTGATT
jgi:hypothetical protein